MIREALHQAHNSKAGFCGMLTDVFFLPYNHHQQAAVVFWRTNGARFYSPFKGF